MTDAPRITIEELKRRMDAGEDFTMIDVRNPNAWAETAVVPEAIRVPLDRLEENLSRIPNTRARGVLHFTRRSLQRQFWSGNFVNVVARVSGLFKTGSRAWHDAGLPVESKRRESA